MRKAEYLPRERADKITILRALALTKCSFLPGSWDKKFSRDMGAIAASGSPFYTERQIENIARMAYKLRRQMPEELVPETPQ